MDCGGDVRVGGRHEIGVRHPLTGHIAWSLAIEDGAVASSGLDRRVWRRPDGSYAHHLLDPSTGAPAWTGVIGATAFAPTTLEAEALAKAALLAGPEAGRTVLAGLGGLLFLDTGEAVAAGLRPRVRLPVAAGLRPRVRLAAA